MTNGTPIHLAPAHSGPKPHRYVIHRRTLHCDCCRRDQQQTVAVYSETRLRSVLGHGYVTNLRPLTWPSPERPQLYNLPIKVIDLQVQRVPFCHLCNLVPASLAHWPAVPADEQTSQRIVAAAQTQPSSTAPRSEARKGGSSTRPDPKPTKLQQVLDIL